MANGSASNPDQPKVVLHWLENSRAQRIAWLLEELGLQYELRPYKRINNSAPPELQAIHPLGKSPILTVGDEVLAESGFIAEYLTSQYSSLRPADNDARSMHDFKYLLHFGEGSLMPPLTIGYIMQSIKNASVPFFIKPITNMIVGKVYDSYLTKTYEGNYMFLERWLAGEVNSSGTVRGGVAKDYFVGPEKGQLSAVDILLSYPLLASRDTGVEAYTQEKYPRLWAWMDRIKLREAFQRAEKRSSEYEPKN